MNQKTKAFRQSIADAFVKALSEKNLEWKKGWVTQAPRNAITGKYYKGINRFILSLQMSQYADMGEEIDCRWATFKQIRDKGWKVKKGAKGQKIEYWQPYDYEKKVPITWEELTARQKMKDETVGVIAKYYVVFNGKDIEGIPQLQPNNKYILSDKLIETIAAGMNIELKHDGGDKAFYHPSEDSIHLPKPENFDSLYAYNSTALHELSHATGAEHRLNRNIHNYFGTEDYAYEELVAEISACFMGEHLEIMQTEEHIQNHKAYVASWIQAIKERPDALMAAIKEAGEAADYLEYQAGILSKEEYQKAVCSSLEISKDKVQEAPLTETKSKPEMTDRKAFNLCSREADLKANGYKPTAVLMKHLKELDALTGEQKTIKDIHKAFRNHEYQEHPDVEKVIKQIGSILQKQELQVQAFLPNR